MFCIFEKQRIKKQEDLSQKLKIYTVYHKSAYISRVPYLHPIQAGRASSEIKLDMEGDDDGENMSALNYRMCELTVLYNVWKNTKYEPAEYWGLCHYRRYFTLQLHWTHIKKKTMYFLKTSEESFKKVFSAGLSNFFFNKLEPATIILPEPWIVKKGDSILTTRDHFCLDHGEDGWDVMKEAVQKLYPEYINAFEETGNKKQFHAYNMMIAHCTVWDEYLTWLFNIVFYINDNFTFSTDPYQSRAMGFMAERLLNVYLHHNSKQYRIVTMPVVLFN